jgi:hypothetical protein
MAPSLSIVADDLVSSFLLLSHERTNSRVRVRTSLDLPALQYCCTGTGKTGDRRQETGGLFSKKACQSYRTTVAP